MVNALLLQPFPAFRDIDRLVAIWSIREDTERYPFTLAEFLDYRKQTHSLDQVAAAHLVIGSLKTPHGAVRLKGARVSANFFEMAGTSAELGRTLEPQDERSAPARVVLMDISTLDPVMRAVQGEPFVSRPAEPAESERRGEGVHGHLLL